jgi:hypothetical protein
MYYHRLLEKCLTIHFLFMYYHSLLEKCIIIRFLLMHYHSLIKKFFLNLLYENALKTQKMNLKPVMACEDTSTSCRSKLYLKLLKHGLWPLVWLTLILVHFIRLNLCTKIKFVWSSEGKFDCEQVSESQFG